MLVGHALAHGLTISASPCSNSTVEIELGKGRGYSNPKFFPGIKAILTGSKQRLIGLADNGKTALPNKTTIVGVQFPLGSKLVRVTWDSYPTAKFYFIKSSEGHLVSFEPHGDEPSVLTMPQSLHVRGFMNLTAVVNEGNRFLAKLRGKAVPKLGPAEFHTLPIPKIEEGLRVMTPSAQFLRATVTKERDDLHEEGTSGPRPHRELAGSSSHALIKLPGDALGESVTPRGYPKDWLTFTSLPSDAEQLVFMDAGLPLSGSKTFGVHHLRTILAAASL